MTDNVQALRDRAADLIEEHGWTQKKFANANGCLCLVGALMAAQEGYDKIIGVLPQHGVWSELVSDAVDIFERKILFDDIVEWNDDPDRTEAEVVAVLRGQGSEQS